MRRAYVSWRAVIFGLGVLLGMAVFLIVLGAAGMLDSLPRIVIAAAVLYVSGGYVTGVAARHDQVLNSAVLGLVFALLDWLVLRALAAGGLLHQHSFSVDVVGLSAGVIAVIACSVGGIFSILLPYRGRKTG